MSEDPHPLDELGRSPVPRIDESASARIESGLRVLHSQQRSTPQRAGWRAWLVAAPALALAVVVVTIALIAGDERGVAALELRGAENVVIALPGGAVVTDPPDGYRLVEGAVLTVGEGGRVTIDDRVLGAGAVVTVEQGVLVTDTVPPLTVDGPPGTGPTSSRSPTTVAETRRPQTTAAESRAPETSEPETRPTDSPAPTQEPRDPDGTLTRPVDRPPTTSAPSTSEGSRDGAGEGVSTTVRPRDGGRDAGDGTG